MGKKPHKKQGKGRSRPSAQRTQSARRRKPTNWLRLGRRIAIGLAVVAVPVLLIGLEVYDNRQRSDLRVIGTGKPVVVQAHDPTCPNCRELLGNAEAAHTDFQGDVAFRVVDLQSSKGRAFGREHDVGKVTLVIFDGEGTVTDILRGVQSVEELRHVFADLADEAKNASK